jgi:hypothetical protein
MNQVLPFVVFALFVALLWTRGVRPQRPTIRGNPPVAGGPDAFGRYGFFAAWAIGIVGLTAKVWPLVAVAGVLIVAVGVVFALNLGGALDGYVARQRSPRWTGRTATYTRRVVPPVMLLIGAVWLVGGLLESGQ